MRREGEVCPDQQNFRYDQIGVNSGFMKAPEELNENASLGDYLSAERTLLAW